MELQELYEKIEELKNVMETFLDEHEGETEDGTLTDEDAQTYAKMQKNCRLWRQKPLDANNLLERVGKVEK